jgi:hypothetical protein
MMQATYRHLLNWHGVPPRRPWQLQNCRTR